MGAAIALELCERHLQTIASVTLIAPFALGSLANQKYVSDFTSAHRSRDVQRCLATLFADPNSVRREMVEAVARYKRIDGVKEALGKIAATVLRDRAPVHELKTPPERILVIRGMHDNIVSDGQTPVGARLETLLHSGHMPQMEEPGQVNALLMEHFAHADRPGVRVR
jgi:pyruvate dehydrogenase E2 component (dihydrolipoamide acetyltransferase)